LDTEPLTEQQQIDALSKEVAALKAERAARALPAWLQWIASWVARKGGWFHVIWISYTAVSVTIATNSEAHAGFIYLWAHLPKWVVSLIAIAGPLVTLALSPNKKPQPPEEQP
jgi:hypothetical protein